MTNIKENTKNEIENKATAKNIKVKKLVTKKKKNKYERKKTEIHW